MSMRGDSLLDRLGLVVCRDVSGAGGVGGGHAGAGAAASSGADAGSAGRDASNGSGSFGEAMAAAAGGASGRSGAGTGGAQAASMVDARAADRRSMADDAADSPTSKASDQRAADARAAETRAAEARVADEEVANRSLDGLAAGRVADRESMPGYAADRSPGVAPGSLAAARTADRASAPGYAADAVPAASAPAAPSHRAAEIASMAALDATTGFGFHPDRNPELGGSFARSYERARVTIAADEGLQREIGRMERAGVKDYGHQLATLMAGLEQNRPAALDAIRGMAFDAHVASSTSVATSIVANLAARQAFDRLDALAPDLGVAAAAHQGYRAARDFLNEQRFAFHAVTADPNLSVSEKIDRLAELGLTDSALAAGLAGIRRLAGLGQVGRGLDAGLAPRNGY